MRAAAPLLLALLLASSGCGSGSGSRSGGREEVEAMVRSELPDSLRRNTGESVYVETVGCVDKGDGDYECIASVAGADGEGGLAHADLPISASCDDESCTWRTTG